jgi:predicted Zn-dependent protease
VFKKATLAVLTLGVITTLGLSKESDATIYNGGRISADHPIYYSSSVSSYGYGTHFDQARNNWNVLSTQVNLWKNASSTSQTDDYYIGIATNPPGKVNLGLTSFYDSTGTPVANYQTWAYSTVTLYDNSMRQLSMTPEQIIGNATHEVGHSISLDHPAISVSSIMNSGVQSIPPTTYDKNDVYSAWGE